MIKSMAQTEQCYLNQTMLCRVHRTGARWYLLKVTVRPTLFIYASPPAEARRGAATHLNSGSTKVRLSLHGLHLAHFKRQPISTWQSVVMQMVADDISELQLVLNLNFYFCLWIFILVCSCCSRTFSDRSFLSYSSVSRQVISYKGVASPSGNLSSKEKDGRKKKEKTFGAKCSNVSYEEWVISTDTYFEEAA